MIENDVHVKVRYAETDQMCFAHHSVYIVWFEYGRVELMRRLGFAYPDLEEQGYLLPVTEIMARYLKPARFDEQLTIRARLLELKGPRIRFGYSVSNEQGQLICEGSTQHGFMNRNDRAVKPPRDLVRVFQKYLEID